ncbi:CLIP domain-containing serine protease B9 [Topomyia yanbarensis]|uniref:CLIP domain-containing serine protease B9 n=1 Tax=Topomyia yanbarensis TaxID=2498891 RepID=UPI00273AF1B7|nr:CLIP domain-containing serine protease B9 [Topomyia yanbarensis]
MVQPIQILAAVTAILCFSSSVLTVQWKTTPHQEEHDRGGTALLDHYFVHHFDQEEPESDQAPSFSRQSVSINCRCVQLRECPKILEMLRTPKSSYSDFNSKLKRLTCGFGIGREPSICCPLDDSWLADEEEQVSRTGFGYGDLDNLKYMQYGKKQFGYGKGSGHEYKYNFITSFEDPKTLKNCPPVIYPVEDVARASNPYVSPAIRRRTTTVRPRAIASNTRTGQEIAPAVEPVSVTATVTEAPVAETTTRLTAIVAPPVINDALCGLSVNTRIIGGETEIPGQFPWMARLAYRNRTSGRVTYRCAGSLITNRHVITVAHCVTNLIDELELVSVRLGDLECNAVTDSRCRNRYQDFAIERLIPHENYDSPKYANDIALVKLQQTTETYNILSPLCLPLDQYSDYARNLTGNTGIIAGWGSTSNRSNTPSPTLQWLRLPIVDTTQCANSYARYSVNSRTPIIVSSNQMCVQGQENMDACQGDSGGPLMNEAISSRDRFVLLGLVSFGPRSCGVSNFPGVYTRISSYTDWIVRQMAL